MAALAGAAGVSAADAADWRQFGYDAAHSGWNRAETTLGPGNVAQLASRYGAVVLPTKVDGAPVYASAVATPAGTRNLLFLLGSDSFSDFSATTSTLVAVDAATGGVVWSKSVSGSGHGSRQHASASPAIDAAKQYVYAFGIDGSVHKYRIGDGTEVQSPGPAGWPAQVTLKPDVEKVASSLTIVASGGSQFLVAVTDGYIGDGGDYQGHLVAIDLGSGARKVFNFMCSRTPALLAEGGCADGRMGGAWGRGGATFDAGTGRVFVATGNGRFDADAGGHDWGDSVLAFAPDGSGRSGGPLDSYTPVNHQALADSDADLGSTSPAVLPVPAGSAVRHLGLQVGKDAQLRLLDLDDLSAGGVVFRDGFDGGPPPARTGGELQRLAVPQGGGGMREQPAVWTDPAGGATWVFVANWAGLSGLQLGLDAGHRPQLSPRWNVGLAATSPVVANGVLYHAGACPGGNGECLVARLPATGAVLWSSPPTGGAHWQSPIVVDGALYYADGDARLWKFALP